MSDPFRNSLLLLFFGLIYIALIPPLQTPDAQTHLYRAYQVSDGGWLSDKRDTRTGGEIPISLRMFWEKFRYLRFHSAEKSSFSQISDSASLQLEPEERRFVGFENTAVFSAFPYLPAALGIIVAKAFSLSVLGIYYVASIATLLASVVIIYLAMRQIPQWSGFVLMFNLLPMSLNLMASVSADSVSNSISLLFIMTVLRLVFYAEDQRKPFFLLWQICLLGALVALSKQTYAAVLLLPLAIPFSWFNGQKEGSLSYFKWFILYGVITGIALFGWAFLSSSVYSPLSWLKDVDPTSQLIFVLNDLPAYWHVVSNDLASKWADYSLLMAGARLGWLDTALPYWLMWSVLAATMAMGILESPTVLTQKRTLLFFSVGVMTVLIGVNLIELALYLHATSYASKEISGIHGRYFLVYFYILILTISTLKPGYFDAFQGKYFRFIRTSLVNLSILTMVISIVYLYQRYYID